MQYNMDRKKTRQLKELINIYYVMPALKREQIVLPGHTTSAL